MERGFEGAILFLCLRNTICVTAVCKESVINVVTV
jgi:hypothetical protein